MFAHVHYWRRSIIAGVFLSFAMHSFAEESPVDIDLFTLSIDDLLQVKVTSTSKADIPIQKAPGVVRVLTAHDFHQFGFRNLEDVLASIPGVQIQRYRTGHDLAWVRGVESRFNDKLLLLVDGVPVRDGHYGNFLLDYSLPLDNVEKIEIINGPGSVLYGSNAFAGVISVTTRQISDEVNITYGSENTRDGSVGANFSDFRVFANWQRSDGFTPEFNYAGQPSFIDANSDTRYAQMKWRHGAWSVQFQGADDHYPETYPVAQRIGSWQQRPMFVSANYEEQLGFGILHAQAFDEEYRLLRVYRRYKTAADGSILWRDQTLIDNSSKLRGSDFEYQWDTNNVHWLTGTSIEQDGRLAASQRRANYDSAAGTFSDYGSATSTLVNPTISRRDIAFYVQNAWDITAQYALTLGARRDLLSDFTDQSSYRMALISNWDAYYGKFLLGTAFRVPSHREYLDSAAYNLSLQPEHLKTLELQVGRRNETADTNLTWYYTRYTDFIKELIVDVTVGDETTTGVEYPLNMDEIISSGLEWSVNYYPGKAWNIRVAAAYLFRVTEKAGYYNPVFATPQTDPAGRLIVDQTPQYDKFNEPLLSRETLHFSASYLSSDAWTFTAQLNYGSARGKPDDYHSSLEEPAKSRDNSGPTIRVDGFIHWQINPHWQAEYRITNMFDARTYSLPFDSTGNYDSEWPGREMEARISYLF